MVDIQDELNQEMKIGKSKGKDSFTGEQAEILAAGGTALVITSMQALEKTKEALLLFEAGKKLIDSKDKERGSYFKFFNKIFK